MSNREHPQHTPQQATAHAGSSTSDDLSAYTCSQCPSDLQLTNPDPEDGTQHLVVKHRPNCPTLTNSTGAAR
jgi:hypothetical protein